MIPEAGQSGYITEQADGEASESPSLTYGIDWKKGRITGYVDGLEALKQAVDKALRTLRYEQLIYSSNYGTEWNLVLGQDRLLARPEIRRVVTEALLQDDRVEGVNQPEVSFNGENVSINVTARSRYGDIQIRKELNANG
ncbi:DUF2634 domain-containing protein [Paenibacillus durus]|uniref:DUF2634 domain-containing protein n=1 Tax=Paenibacillus durus TaxID=44251 RepID=A0A089HV14_PAEDU|nr:DUF2634 domain-containing protein [Paenibacillus durus]AIQ14620.1 hypothetical protein PDUR_24085 [Paenibacillus durus]